MGKKVYSDKKTKPEKIEQSRGREIAGLVIYFLVVLVAMFLVIKFVAQRTLVIGQSMETTLHDGDNLITDKISYRFTDPKRFDIIVFPFKENRSTLLIKRIVGMPGETVQIRDGKIYINDQELDESYGNGRMSDPGLATEPIRLGPEEYFVLGDNRNNSTDSRFASVGNIQRSEIIGRAWLRIWPLNKFSLLKHQ